MCELILAGVYLYAAMQGASDGVTIAGEAILLAWCLGQAWQAWREMDMPCLVCAAIFMALAPMAAEAKPLATPHAATTPTQDGAALQREAKAQALIEVLGSPSATEAQRWAAAHELLWMDRRSE
jgi:hypothetical protein